MSMESESVENFVLRAMVARPLHMQGFGKVVAFIVTVYRALVVSEKNAL